MKDFTRLKTGSFNEGYYRINMLVTLMDVEKSIHTGIFEKVEHIC